MIAIILAAGKGSRISKITQNKPKSFLELSKNFSIIDYQINILRKIGVKKILVVTGYKDKYFKKKFKNEKDIKLLFNKQWSKTNVLSSFCLAIPHINDDFIFLHADSLIEIGIYKKLRKKNEIILPFKKRKCGYEEMKIYKILNELYLSKNKLRNKYFGEFVGIAFFPKKSKKIIIEGINFLKKNIKFKSYYFEEIINYICKNKKIKVKVMDIKNSKYQEVDFFSDFKNAKKKFGKYNEKFF